MKNSVLRKRIMIVTLLACVLTALIMVTNKYVLKKSYAYNEAIYNIATYVDVNDNPTSATFALENIYKDDKSNLSGSSYKISSNLGTTIDVLNINTNESVLDSNVFYIPEDGVLVKLDNIVKNNTYTITIEPKDPKPGYRNTFKKIEIEVNYNDVLFAQISKIIDLDNNEVNIDENDKALFLFTDTDNKIHLRAHENVEISYFYSLDEVADDNIDNQQFNEYDKTNYLSVSTNGYLYAKSRYKTNGYSKVTKLHITNIDKLAPNVIVNSALETQTHDSAIINFNLVDQEATKEYGKSEVKGYYIDQSPDVNTNNFINVDSTAAIEEEVFDSGTYYIHVIDNAGNTNTVSVEASVTNVSNDYVLVILESPYPELNGNLFNSFDAMTNRFRELGVTSNDNIVAQVIHEIKNQKGTIENVNLTLDLNGFEINSKKNDSILDIKSTTHMKIVDNKYDINEYIPTFSDTSIDYTRFVSGEGYGKMSNTTKEAIYIEEGGILDLGEDNSPDLAHVEYPEHNSPYIFGKIQGINIEGEFNYYDGVIVGTNSIKGDINNTPNLYDPSVVKDDENNLFIMTLEEVTNIEAVIGKTRYTLIENAIEAANNRIGTINDQIRIDIVRDLSKGDSVTVPDNKNIIINLNGHTFTNVVDQPVLINYGKTVLIDSGETGIIESETNTAVVNNTPGEFELRSGKIYARARNKQSLINNEEAKLNITGGEIYKTEEGTIFQNRGGIVDISGGNHHGVNEWSTLFYNHDVVTDDEESTTTLDMANIVADTERFNYTFALNSEGVLEPNTYDYTRTQAQAYYIVDLTSYNSNEKFVFKMNVEANLHGGSYFYAYVNTDNHTQIWTEGRDRFAFRNYSYSAEPTDYSTTLTGGNKYYIHIGLDKDTGKDDREYVKINSMKLEKKVTHVGRVHVNGGEFSGSYACLNNDSLFGQYVIDEGTVKCRYSVESGGPVIINGGTFTNPIRNYSKTYFNGGTAASLYNIRGTVYVTGGTISTFRNEFVDDRGYTRNDKNHYTYISGGTLGYIESLHFIEIKNANITWSIYIGEESLETNIDNCTINGTYGHESISVINNNAKTTTNVSNTNITALAKFQLYQDPTNRLINNGNTGELNLDNMVLKLDIVKNDNGNNVDNITRGYGMVNGSTGTININNVTLDISSDFEKFKTYGIYNSSTGTINIGKKDNTYHKDTTYIHGPNYGLYTNRGYFNLYDGNIKAKDRALYYSIHEIEDNYYVKRETTEDNEDYMYLTNSNIENILNVETGVKYASLGEAIDAAANNQSLRFLNSENYEVKNYTYEIPEGKKLTIDFNGKNVYLGNGLINNGELTFIDSGEEKGTVYSQHLINNNKLHITGSKYYFEFKEDNGLINNGTLDTSNCEIRGRAINDQLFVILNNGTYTQNENALLIVDSGNIMLVYNDYTGSMYLKGGDIKQLNEGNLNNSDGKAIYNAGGYVEEDGTLFTLYSRHGHWCPTLRPIYNSSKTVDDTKHTGMFKMKSGTINDTGTNSFSVINTGADCEMSGGKFQKTGMGVLSGSNTHIINGTFENVGYGVYVEGGTLTVDNATITSNDTGIYGRADNKVTVNNIDITAPTGARFEGGYYGDVDTSEIVFNAGTINASGKGIYIGNPKEVHISNMTITVNGNQDAHGLSFDSMYNSSSGVKVYVKNTTISAITSNNTNYKAYGIYGVGLAGELTISNEDGDDDSHVSITNPNIYGEDYGIYRDGGTFNFYDGIIRGNTQIYGGVNSRPEDYELYYDTDDVTNTVYLKKLQIAENTDTHEIYSNIQTAFNSCTDNTRCNIKLLYPIVLSNKLTIPETKDISLDLNELQIEIVVNKHIENNGIFRVKNGKLIATTDMSKKSLLENYGEFYAEEGCDFNIGDLNNARLIYNHEGAKVYVNGGKLTATRSYWNSMNSIEGKMIYNLGGEIIVNSGEIYSNSASYWGGSTEIDCFTSTVDGTTYKPSITINGGTLKDYGSGTFITLRSGTLTMTAGSIEGGSSTGVKLDNSTANITGGSFTNFYHAILMTSNNNVSINGLTIKSASYSGMIIDYDNTGNTITIDDITIQSCFIGLDMEGRSNTLTVNKATISGTTALKVTRTNTINLNNVTANQDSSNNETYGIFNDGENSTINIKNSTFTVRNSGGRSASAVYINQGNPTINISNDDDEVSTTSSVFDGTTYGLYRTGGTIKFYDGIFKGNTPLFGGIDDRPIDYTIYRDTQDGVKVVYLKKMNVAKNTTTNTEYDTLQKALNSCADNTPCTVQLLYDLVSEQQYTIANNKDITIDFNEHEIDIMRNKNILNNGTLRIKNGKLYSELSLNDDSLIINHGKLYIEEGSELTANGLYNTKLIYNHDDGKIYVNGGKLVNDVWYSNTSRACIGGVIYNEAGYVEINGGSIFGVSNNYWGQSVPIKSISKTVNNEKKRGTIIINGGTIKDYGDYRTTELSDTDITMNNGLFDNSNNPTAIYGNSSTIFTMNGGTIKKSYHGVNIENGSITIVNGTFEDIKTYAIYPYSSNTLIKNVSINTTNRGIQAEGSSSVTIDNATINATNYGIVVAGSSSLQINDGTIYATANDSIGLYADTTNTVTIGNNDGVVSQTIPHIKGKGTGLHIQNNNGTISFYDGKITGDTIIVNGEIDNVPQDYRVVEIDGNTYILRLKSDIQDTFEYKGIYFQNINMPIEMINNSSTKTGKINVWNDVILSNGITIPEGLNITLALQGHTIQFTDVETGITNNGTLTIIDGELDEIDEITESNVINTNGTTIVNNGTLTIGQNNNPNTQSPKIIGNIGYTGNEPTVKSGYIQSTSTNSIFDALGAALNDMFAPSYSYVHKEYEIMNIDDSVALANSPITRTIKPITIGEGENERINWTNENMDVGLTSHNYGILNIVSEADPSVIKQMNYIIEVYKNNVKDEYSSISVTKDVQYLKNTISVDLNFFDDVKTKFKGYYLTRMTINDTETNEIPTEVEDKTIIRLYYGQEKGDEIDLRNPKTGRKSYIIPFIVSVAIATVITIFVCIHQKKKYESL